MKLKKSELDAAFNLILTKKRKMKNKCYNRETRSNSLCSRLRRDSGIISTQGTSTTTQKLLTQINRAVLRHDWEGVATCIEFLLELNGKLLPVIWKAFFLVLLNHKNSSTEKIKEFLSLNMRLTEDNKQIALIKEFLSLPEDISNYNIKTNRNEDLDEFELDYSVEDEI